MKAMEVNKKFYRDNHPKIASTYNNLGLTCSARGNYEEAVQYQMKALAIYKHNYGEDHAEIAGCLNNIASVYTRMKDYTLALEYFNKSLDMYQKILGEQHLKVATIYDNLAWIYSLQKDYSKSMECYNKVLTIYLKHYSENHIEVAKLYDTMGEVLLSQHDYVRAFDYFQKSQTIKLSCTETEPELLSNISKAYWLAKGEGIELKGFREYISTRVFIANASGKDTPAANVGMSGEYYILEFADWTMDSDASLFAKNEELRGKPKAIVVMKGDEISQFHFENIIGVQFGFKHVGEGEKQRIIKAYHEWKKKQ